MISGTFLRSMSLTRIIFTNYQSNPRIKWGLSVAFMTKFASIEITLIPIDLIADNERLIISVVLKISLGFFNILSSTVSFWILLTSLQNTIPLLHASNKSSLSMFIGSSPSSLQNASSFNVSLITLAKQTFSSSAYECFVPDSFICSVISLPVLSWVLTVWVFFGLVSSLVSLARNYTNSTKEILSSWFKSI